jgi:hypothetical protein
MVDSTKPKLADSVDPVLTDPVVKPVGSTPTALPSPTNPVVEPKAESAQAAVPSSTDIFNDLDALREQSKPTVRRRSVLVNVSVVKHPANNKYFRAHPTMSLPATVIWDDRNCYYVTPGMRSHLKLINRIKYVTLHLIVQWPEQQPLLWPIPIVTDGRDFPVWRSYRKAVELAQSEWMQICWDDLKRDFNIEPAENISAEPVWPKEGFSELLKIALDGFIIDNDNHPYLNILRGRDD